MSSMSVYLKSEILNCTLRGIAYTPPAAVFIALFLSDPTELGTGTEVTGGGYNRKAVAFSLPNESVTTNLSDVTFDEATAPWGTITHVAVYDGVTGGNLLYFTELEALSQITILIGQQLELRPGDISVQFE